MQYLSMKNLRNLRKRAGLTAEELAEKCGFHQSQISKMETGAAGYSAASVAALSSALCVPEWQLFIDEREITIAHDDDEKTLLALFHELGPIDRKKALAQVRLEAEASRERRGAVTADKSE